MTRLPVLACHALTGAAGLSALAWAAMPGHHPIHVLTLWGVAMLAGFARLVLEES